MTPRMANKPRVRLAFAGAVISVGSALAGCMPSPAPKGPTVFIGTSLTEGDRIEGEAQMVESARQPTHFFSKVGQTPDQMLSRILIDPVEQQSVREAATVVLEAGTNVGPGNFEIVMTAISNKIYDLNPSVRILLVPLFAQKKSVPVVRDNDILARIKDHFTSTGKNIDIVLPILPGFLPKNCLRSDNVHPQPWCYKVLAGRLAFWINAPAPTVATTTNIESSSAIEFPPHEFGRVLALAGS